MNSKPLAPRRAILASAASASVAALAGLWPAAALRAQRAIAYPIVVLNSRDADLSLIDPVSHEVIGRVPTGKEPHHLYPTPDNAHVVVGNAVSDTLTFINPETGRVEMSMQGVADPYHLGFSPDQNFFVTCANRLHHVDVYRRVGHADKLNLKGLARFELAKTPSHLIFSSDSRIAYCTLQDSDEVVAIDLQRLVVLWRIPVGKLPAGIAISPDSKLLFVGVMGADHVAVIDPASGAGKTPRVVQRIATGEGAHAFRNHGNKRDLWVSNRVANTISRIDMGTLKVQQEVAVPGGPDCMEMHKSGKQLWVTQRWVRSVSMVDLDQSKVVKRIQVGRSPHGVYLHDRAGLL